MTMVATTTAWGNARPLDAVLKTISEETDATTVELAIGALPIEDPETFLEYYAERFTYVGHHAMPIGKRCMIRPEIGNEKVVVDACRRFNISSYSAHPPAGAGLCDFLNWAYTYWQALAEHGIAFAVETMFPDSRDARYLANSSQVWHFARRAIDDGWSKPLLVDVSHLNIGVSHGVWSHQDIVDLLTADVAHEIHVSSNDGWRDQHRPLDPNSREAGWAALVQAHPFLVDEGRRRRVTPRR